jgi:asparagine synthase (glutamine-hydrolysing)
LRSAFPVVSLLSGGLDSSAVTAGAAKILGTQGGSLTALSAVLPPGYRGKAKDEKYYIDLLQGRDGLNIQYITDVWRGPFDDVERLVRGGDRPVFTSRHFLYSAFADKASEFNARVVLDGLCGELGPSHYGRGYYAELLRKGYWATLLREITALSRIENRKMSGIVRSEVLRPLAPKILMRFFGSRFDVGQIRKWTPIKRSFLDAQLGNEVSMYLNESIATFHHCSDHRKNHLEVVRRFSERGRLVDGFAGYEQIEMSYPFLDKRVLEFCLSLPGHMKVRNGYRRYMIRAGMKHVLSDELRFRVSKMPFSPDFHERYNRQRLQALHVINNIRRNELIDEIVDIEKLKTMLQYDMKDSRSNTPEAFAAMHAVPWGFFLLHFLDNV